MLQQISNKDEVSGYISPAEFNQGAEFVQLEYVTENFNPKTKLGYESDSESSDAFSSLKKTVPLVVSNGKITKPDDYLHFSSAYLLSDFGMDTRTFIAEMVRDDEWAERHSSEINKPSFQFPLITNRQGEFWVSPKTADNISLTYIRIPLKPWWNYTLNGDGEPVFAETGGTTTNPNTGVAAGDSTDFELDESEIPYLVQKLCKYFAIEVSDEKLFQLVDAEIKTED